jgi:hypothetical protein
MYTGQRIQKKTRTQPSSSATEADLFRHRPLINETDQTPADLENQETPDLQAQSETAARFGHNFGRVKVQDSTPAFIQPKLAIGAPGDKYEQEADSVAAQVMSMNTPASHQSLQRQGTNPEEEEVQMKPLASMITPLVQRQEAAPEEEELQAKPLVQRQEAAPEEEELQAKPLVQRQEAAPEEEELQAKPLVQRQEEAPEEEELQAKPLVQRQEEAPEEEELQAKPLVQRQEEAPEEEELQAKPLVQRQEASEEEELQAKPLVQRQEAAPEEEELQAKPLVQRQEAAPEEEELQAKPLVQRQEEAPEEELQAKRSHQEPEASRNDASGNLEHQLNTTKGGGSPLPDDVRSFMEPRFGADFSQVRVHTDSQAVQMNQAVGAQAFTHGSDIYFGEGKSPGISDLTAHELTHVVQQTGGVQRKLPDKHADALKHHQARDRVVVKSEPGTPQVQKSDPVSAASLGVAVFEAGRSYANSGNLYHNGNTPSYMHERTPAEATWEDVVTDLRIQAHHPRVGWGNQDFYYRLSYQRNGYDIRNAQVDVLRNRSSGMYTSTFGSTWSGQTHSRPTASVAEIVFNISGEWNPHGRGHVSWWGQLVLSAAKGGSSYQSFTVGSEQDWVWSV